MNHLTIIILTYNEEKNIQDCLSSLRSVTKQIFVVDSFSSDNTLHLLKENNIFYTQHVFENYSNQRNWAQLNNPFQTEWVLHVDAGERATPELVTWLKNNFNPDAKADGYMFSRKTMFMNKWIKHGGHYPNYHLRLFKVTKGKCEDKVYDQHFVVDGSVEIVKAGIDIIDTVADNLRDFTIRHSKWAMYEAVDILSSSTQKGEVKASMKGTPIEKRRWLKSNVFQKSPLFVRSFLYFIYRYIIKLGILDGSTGLIFHFLQGFWFRFLVDSMVFELRTKMERGNSTLEELIKKEYSPDLLKLLR